MSPDVDGQNDFQEEVLDALGVNEDNISDAASVEPATGKSMKVIRLDYIK